ncbi:mitochondrial tRNA methylthiotransferase CDK5RAP1-like [Styela clava]
MYYSSRSTQLLLHYSFKQCFVQRQIVKVPKLFVHHSVPVLSPNSKLSSSVPDIKEFILNSNPVLFNEEVEDIVPPYLREIPFHVGKKVYFEAYGCQMNVNDSEYAWAILQKKGYERTNDITEAEVILLVTCSIRDKAEEKIWSRLHALKKLKQESVKSGFPKIGILGCMAERLKKEIVEKQKAVDIVAGPDAYRDLPRLLEECSENSTATINVMLSMDETYADIMPVRFNEKSKKAFVSIMRGCDNMCSYCIVPFTRGRERSRPVSSILEEVKTLSDKGIKEVTLLGQNVNSYRDISESHHVSEHTTSLAKGFKTIYKPKIGGLRFADLLDKVSLIDPEMRIRFTSPHPKDFPDEVLQIVKDRSNICKQLHMPAQSGSTAILEKMRRGYSREDYLELAQKIRNFIPGVTLSSDMIAGFCGETEFDHKDTLSLMREVKFENAFMFAYSMRKKTHAYHKMKDDVPHDVKNRRLREIIDCYHNNLTEILPKHIGKIQLVLVDGTSKKSKIELLGRNDGNIKVVFPDVDIFETVGCVKTEYKRKAEPGDYVVVKITDIRGFTLLGEPLSFVSLTDFSTYYPSPL